jgi:hypothetical protein
MTRLLPMSSRLVPLVACAGAVRFDSHEAPDRDVPLPSMTPRMFGLRGRQPKPPSSPDNYFTAFRSLRT